MVKYVILLFDKKKVSKNHIEELQNSNDFITSFSKISKYDKKYHKIISCICILQQSLCFHWIVGMFRSHWRCHSRWYGRQTCCVLGVDLHPKGNKTLVRYVTILIRRTTKFVISLQNLQVLSFVSAHIQTYKKEMKQIHEKVRVPPSPNSVWPFATLWSLQAPLCLGF